MEPKKVVESKSVQRRRQIQNEAPLARRMGISLDVASFLAGKDEGASVETIAESINCTTQQVEQVLTKGKKTDSAGNKTGMFRTVRRGVWTLA